MSNPLVSVLIPCYNVEKFVEESVNSILNQTYTHIEVIAINDCSTDRTGEILYSLAKEDPRITVISNEENLKLIKTLNKGIKLCSGEYIARMDSDDIALPTRIEKEVDFLEKNKDHDIVSTLFYAFRSENPNRKDLHHSPLTDEELRAFILFKSGICHPAVMIRKRVFTELGLSFEQEYLHVEDYALWSKAIYNTRLANIGEPLLLYRVHQHQISSLYEDVQTENKKKVFKIHCRHLGLPEDDDFIDVYASVAECVPLHSSVKYLDKCEELMLKLIEINKDKPFCSMPFLERMLSVHWLRLCANSRLGLSVIKRMKQSLFYKNENYTSRDLAIFYTKSTFKLKYKKSLIYKLVFR
ncbi:glycosyltransferase involved in cell wall biosynthesis [Dysgonomonas hofstadii]|uniref:Glycosyltransferase involved in cell wall biosynthesis n=1 Tax=Dysgonomonas hofstadii TaxID=637886 RepID=A0A840CLZ5_9BACT|nr:glycosyltransferase family 2 protein [Dysgonomonas hofstadii]MBB4036141.1 glycosyltransferase involved in cell wall biosynthesis [Dysgonomonas hofstadii]